MTRVTLSSVLPRRYTAPWRQALQTEPRSSKPFTTDVRANIDNELVDKSVDFMKRQHAAGKPFFLYLPFSMGHVPNLPPKEFAGKSRIGNYGDKIMEGDYHVGQILDALKDLGLDNDTVLIFASDNGPYGEVAREFGNQGTPDVGNSGPFRGELGEATEGAIRTFAFVRWPGHVKPDTTSYAMFSIMDFFPTLANIVGGTMPTDRPVDGVDQSDVLRPQCHGTSRYPIEFYWAADGGGTMEAVAHLFYRCPSDRIGAAASARPAIRQRANGWLSEGLQHRNGPA
jgi:arylsulfatase A-like enzyme